MNIKPKARETASDGFHLIGREDGARSLIQHKVTKAKSLQSQLSCDTQLKIVPFRN